MLQEGRQKTCFFFVCVCVCIEQAVEAKPRIWNTSCSPHQISQCSNIAIHCWLLLKCWLLHTSLFHMLVRWLSTLKLQIFRDQQLPCDLEALFVKCNWHCLHHQRQWRIQARRLTRCPLYTCKFCFP